ncbi:MAG: alpha/beta fold hydrolase [Chloroflexi bacterium]|nr:alpha/beta fold hydrolase [Chloroflexota bacterium]
MIFPIVVIFIILLVFFLDHRIERMYQYEGRKHRITPEKHQIAFDVVHIPSAKDTHLYGWWIPVSPDSPTLILIHGWGHNLARMMPYIRALHPLGYNLLAFDARNHGHSSPVKQPSIETFTEDALAVVDFIVESGLVSKAHIGIVGLSVGGGAGINTASWDPRVKSVITVGAFSHPIDVMNLEFQKKKIPNIIPWLLFKYMRLRFGIDFDKFAPLNNITQANAHIFLIHGEQDETIPLSQGQALAGAGNPQSARFWVVPGKGHSDCHTHPQFWEKVEAFLQLTLSVPKRATSFVEESKIIEY